MKKLIKNIKYNRLPKEVLYLMGLLYKNKLYENKLVDPKSSYVIFLVSKSHKTISPYYTNIHLMLGQFFYNYGLIYDREDIKKVIITAINNSIYSEYEIV